MILIRDNLDQESNLGIQRNAQVGKYFVDGASRIFDILDVGMRGKGAKEGLLEFQPEQQLNEQRCDFQKEEPLV